jgi:phosphate transport system substrate-binding protein
MPKFKRAAFAAFCLVSGLGIASAEDITLTSRDGKIALNGRYLGFDGEYYRIDTIYGELTVDGSGVLCDGPACPTLDGFVARVGISGSASMGEVLLPALIEGFAQAHGFIAEREAEEMARFLYRLSDRETGTPSAVFHFHTTDSSEGFADLLANEADMVMSLREIRPLELERAREAGLGDMSAAPQARVLALDAIVPVVALGNPVRGISPTDLARVFAGEIRNWKDLGGPDAPISPHAPLASTGLGQTIGDRIMAPPGREMSGDVTQHQNGPDVVTAVRLDPFALGIASLAEAGTAQVPTLTGSCGRSLDATRQSVKTEDYPFTAPMFLYLPARRQPLVVQEFLAFTQSPAAQIVIRRAGFVDQAPEEIVLDEQGNRLVNAVTSAGEEIGLEELQRMVSTLEGLRRLTISFRFGSGSAELDAQSKSNIEYLAGRLEQGDFDGRRLLFVGFSDGDGPAEANRLIALDRAEAVRRAVQGAAVTLDTDRVPLDVDAFGEAMPIACDDTIWGQKANRRVEVWVR